MNLPRPIAAEADFRRLARVKAIDRSPARSLGTEMIEFFKHSVEKRQTKLGKLSECWAELVPETLCAHCVLDSLYRGSLTVLVDSSSHLYELKQLLLAGLEDQLLLACQNIGLRKISLKPGRGNDSGIDRRPRRFN